MSNLIWNYIKNTISTDYIVQIINKQNYITLFEQSLKEEEFNKFKQIIKNDKFALLYKNDELLAPVCKIKLENKIIKEYQPNKMVKIEKLLDNYNKV